MAYLYTKCLTVYLGLGSITEKNHSSGILLVSFYLVCSASALNVSSEVLLLLVVVAVGCKYHSSDVCRCILHSLELENF